MKNTNDARDAAQEVVISILMHRDGMPRSEAIELLDECRLSVEEGDDPEDVLYYDLRLEPDYIFALL